MHKCLDQLQYLRPASWDNLNSERDLMTRLTTPVFYREVKHVLATMLQSMAPSISPLRKITCFLLE